MQLSCDAKRGLIFAEHLDQNLLLLPHHRHLVFTLPKRLRIFFKFNRKLCKYLYTAAWQAWSGYLSLMFPKSPLAKAGAIMAPHTAGGLLHSPPHIYALALDGDIEPKAQLDRLTQCDLTLIQSKFESQIFNAPLEEKLVTEGNACLGALWF